MAGCGCRFASEVLRRLGKWPVFSDSCQSKSSKLLTLLHPKQPLPTDVLSDGDVDQYSNNVLRTDDADLAAVHDESALIDQSNFKQYTVPTGARDSDLD